MGFENLWKNTEVNIDLLEKSKCFRHKDSVDPQEIKNNGVGIEQYAFAVLCETVLRKDSEYFRVGRRGNYFSLWQRFCLSYFQLCNFFV